MYIPKASLALPHKANATGICTHFIYSGSSTNAGYFRLGNAYVFMIYTEYTDVDEWKAWLQQNPITVDYELAEEVIEPFDEEQQAVIDDLYNDGTFKGVTNISSSSLIKPEFDIEYYKDLEILFNNLSQAIIGGN